MACLRDERLTQCCEKGIFLWVRRYRGYRKRLVALLRGQSDLERVVQKVDGGCLGWWGLLPGWLLEMLVLLLVWLRVLLRGWSILLLRLTVLLRCTMLSRMLWQWCAIRRWEL